MPKTKSWLQLADEMSTIDIGKLKDAGKADSFKDFVVGIEETRKEVLSSQAPALDHASKQLCEKLKESYLNIIDVVSSPETIIKQVDKDRRRRVGDLSEIISRQRASLLTLKTINFRDEAGDALRDALRLGYYDLTNISVLMERGDVSGASADITGLSGMALLPDDEELLTALRKKIRDRVKERLDTCIENIDERNASSPEAMENVRAELSRQMKADIVKLIAQLRVHEAFAAETHARSSALKADLKVEEKSMFEKARDALYNRAKSSIAQSGRIAAARVTSSALNLIGIVGTSISATNEAASASAGIVIVGLRALKEAALEVPRKIANGLGQVFQSVAVLTEAMVEVVEAVLPTVLVILVYLLLGFLGTSFASAAWAAVKNVVTNHLLPWVALHLSNIFVI